MLSASPISTTPISSGPVSSDPVEIFTFEVSLNRALSFTLMVAY